MGVTPSVKASVPGLNYCQETGAVVVGTDKGVMVMDTVIGHPHVRDLQAALFPICNKGTYISNYLENAIKSNQIEINTDSKTFKTIARLKEPRDLFALPKELDCPQQAARWPTECQVLEHRVYHIEYSPPVPECYYIRTGRELQPKPVGEESGTVMFQYYPMSAVNYFSRSSVGGSRYFMTACSNNGCDDELHFESRFESGNLAKAVKITSTYYELYLRTDLYTNRHMQWFYFKVTSTRKHVIYRFSIVNLSKGESLYNEGMRPLMYSEKDAQLHSIGWRRCADNISYYKNDPTCEEEEQSPSYTLTFNVEFPHENDVVYLAHCYPYTYSDLQDYLCKLQNHPVKSTFTKLRLLCRTLAGNNVYYLTITAPPNENESKKKKAIVITARVHPGETPSSWMMKGFMDFLTGDSSQARELREKFIFKLVPMLNPDGVIVGNNRCSLTGKDLNRQYRTVIRETYPPVWHTKLMIRRLIEECGVVMYCDLHAHSRKHNVFIYGCENRRGLDKRLHEQVFPLMLHKNCADKFSFESCKFRIQRSKEGTGRVVIWMMGVANSYTMEASFGGSELGGRVATHFSTQDYEALGRAFCETLLDFCDENPHKERLRNKIINRLLKEGSSADEPTNINLSDYSSDEGDTSSSSSDEESRLKRQNLPKRFPAPPPSPVLLKTKRSNKKSRPKHDKLKISPKIMRQALPIYRTTIDLTTDAGSDVGEASTEFESCDESSPVRRLHKQFRASKTAKLHRRKRMPPELQIVPAQNTDSPEQSDKEKTTSRISRAQSASARYETVQKKIWHQFRCFPQPKSISDVRLSRKAQTSELQIKLTTLRNNIWTGVQSEQPNVYLPLSWGISNLAMKNYTDSESLLRSCSKKLESIENYISRDDDNELKLKKIKPKAKIKIKLSSAVNEYIQYDQPTVSRAWKKKTRLKPGKQEAATSSINIMNTIKTEYGAANFSNGNLSGAARHKFRKGVFVATAIQSKKARTKQLTRHDAFSDQSDSGDSHEYVEKTVTKKKKKRKSNGKRKIQKDKTHMKD
ncbi:cytosolic carboxypeptidase 2-like [Arctopsyche grandis]|uniref:cytosolic carboxypeptidase 2-like n=1 Tax=Arctopsyche grandis TaxID=121162 RepID=UPI00406D810F